MLDLIGQNSPQLPHLQIILGTTAEKNLQFFASGGSTLLENEPLTRNHGTLHPLRTPIYKILILEYRKSKL
jgi:hypothetical protein